MRIVKLDELDDEERKRVLQEQQQRTEQNNIARQQLQQQANNAFNNNIQNNRDISINPIKTTENNTSIWSRILGAAQNTGLGAINGIKSLQQTLGRTMTNGLADRADLVDETQNKMMLKMIEKNPNEAEKISRAILKTSVSGDAIRQNAQEQYQKIQQQKEKNQIKIQENADKMNTSVGKYLSGDILPAIGQMAPGFIGGPIGTTYFIGSATGNYYDDAKQRGMNESQATAYSGIMGIIEGSLESIGSKLTTNVGKQLLKKNIKGALVNYGLDIAENFLEESIVEPIQEIVAGATADKANWDNIGQRFIESGIDGAVVSAITGGISGTIGAIGSNFQSNKYIDTKTGETLNKDAQNWINKARNIVNENQQIASNEQYTKIEKLANNQQTLYNNFNESESDINGQNNGQFNTRNEITSGLYEESKPQQDRQFSWEEYNRWEQSIKPITENKLTQEQSQIKKKVKEDYNKEVFFFDEAENDNTYSGGASQSNPSRINISKQQAETFGQNKMIYHEVLESDILNNFEKYNDVLEPTIEAIINDNNFEQQKNRFWINQEGNAPSDFLIAKDILCDRFSEMKTGENVDYKNVLSKETNMNIDYALENFHKELYGKSISQENIAPIGENVKRQNSSEINLPTKAEQVDWNDIERPEDNKKFRKHYKSIIESSQTTKEAKAISKELMGTDTYVPETNKGQLLQADERIANSSPEAELQSLLSRAVNGEKVNSVDIAVGERLIQYFSKIGNKQQLQEAIQATALAGTSAGQTVQALSILNHQTPQGQATWIQRSVDKMNKELAKKKSGIITTDENGNQIVVNKQGKDITNKVDLFELTPEMLEKITNSKTQEEMYKNIDEVYEELGQQVPKSMIEKIDSWRYFSMLANPRTHIRNMVGNFAMGKMQTAKNKVAGAIEDVASKFNPNMERSHTLKSADKKTKEFSKNDFKNADVQSRLELNENKYNPQSRLQNARRTFKSDAMEKTLGRLFDLNDNLLEAEDGIGLKAGYIKAMNEYLTANKIDVDTITDTQLNKARNYAIQQAKEATFHQANAIASAVNQFQNKNNVTKFFVDAILPFKKTPMNVAKSGIKYSPVQIAKSATLDLINLKKGNITVNQYIDNLSKGLTGTGIAFAGYALAKAGILKANGDDDKDKEKFDEEQGKQSYAITIGGKTYSLDWLAPTGIPLFIGAEFQKVTAQDNSEKSAEKTNDESKLNEIVKSVANIANAGATAINPMSEMSMISGLTSVLSSYNKENALGDMMTNAGKSYVNQFVPTVLGQVAKTGDKYERTTKSTKTGTLEKAVDQTINQIKSKVPGLRQTLPVRTDIWGRDKENEPNLPLRAFNNFINPATVKNISTDKVDKELNKLYDVNGSSSILPDILQKTFKIQGTDYRLTNKEYADYTKKYGETSYNLIKSLVSSSDYKSLTQTQKEEAIANIYSFAKESNKIDYANKNGVEVKPSTLYTTMESLKKDGGKQSDYLNYLSKTKTLSKEKDKNQALANSSYSDKTKEIIYSNGTGKDDKFYNSIVKNSDINITEYLNYKVKDSNKDFSDDKNIAGKSLSETGERKQYDYVNKNITGYENRLLILGSKYKLSDTERKSLAEYINNNYSKADLIGVYENLDKNFTVKNGKVYYK